MLMVSATTLGEVLIRFSLFLGDFEHPGCKISKELVVSFVRRLVLDIICFPPIHGDVDEQLSNWRIDV